MLWLCRICPPRRSARISHSSSGWRSPSSRRWARAARSWRSTTRSRSRCRTCTRTSCPAPRATGCAASSGRAPSTRRTTRRRPTPSGSGRGSGVASRVVVTGGSGKLGRAVVARPGRRTGTRCTTSTGSVAAPGGRRHRFDLADYGQAVEALSGIEDRYASVDAVVHLAAVPAPGLIANAATFRAQHHRDAQRLRGGPRWPASATWCGRAARRCSGLPFDDAPAAVLPGGRGVSRPGRSRRTRWPSTSRSRWPRSSAAGTRR